MALNKKVATAGLNKLKDLFQPKRFYDSNEKIPSLCGYISYGSGLDL